MADLEGLKVSKDYHVDVPFANQEGFFLKGINSLDWGMKKRMSNIFDPKSGNTVMFAFDHGYFMGSTAGLERLDLLLPQLELAFLTSPASLPLPGQPARRIRLDGAADSELLRRSRPRLRFAKKVSAALMEEAVVSLAQAKSMHDDLEAIYNPHVDFSLVDNLAQDIWNEIRTF